MTKVGKSDGEGTFAGTRGNDKVAPEAAIAEQVGGDPLHPQPRRLVMPSKTTDV
jgi:hypothetical protein